MCVYTKHIAYKVSNNSNNSGFVNFVVNTTAKNETEFLLNSDGKNFLEKKLGSINVNGGARRTKRFFVNQEIFWRNKNNISYSLFTDNIPAALDPSVVLQETHQALTVWNNTIAYDTHLPILKLVYVGDNNDTANIKIKFLHGDHNDLFPFDGPNGVLAHAFPPPNGEVHLDADEFWLTQDRVNKTNTNNGVSFLNTLIHEIGHSLGLFHSHVNHSIMYPFYQGNRLALDKDDLNGLDQLYVHNKRVHQTTVVNSVVSSTTKKPIVRLTTTTPLPPPAITTVVPPKIIPSWVNNDEILGNGVSKQCSLKYTGVGEIRGEYYLFTSTRYWRFRDFNFNNLIETRTYGKGHWPHVCTIVSVATQNAYIHIIDHHLWYTYKTTVLVKVEPLSVKYNIIFEENKVLYGVVKGAQLYRVTNNEYVGRVSDKFLGFKRLDWILVTPEVISVGVGRGKWMLNVVDKKDKLGNVYVANDEPTHLMYGC